MNKSASMLVFIVQNLGGAGTKFHFNYQNNSEIGFPVSQNGRSGYPISRDDLKKRLLEAFDECMPPQEDAEPETQRGHFSHDFIATSFDDKWRCRECGCYWRRGSNDRWSLYDSNQHAQSCCDNSEDFLSKIAPASTGPLSREEAKEIAETLAKAPDALMAFVMGGVLKMPSDEPLLQEPIYEHSYNDGKCIKCNMASDAFDAGSTPCSGKK